MATIQTARFAGGFAYKAIRKKTRLYLDNEYFKEGYAAAFPHSVTAVYGALAMFANHRWQICYPAAATLMKHCGITNRNTLFQALKILEEYGIIAIVHRSKGRIPNTYVMLSSSHWKSLNSINFDTVMERVKKKKTVSVSTAQQSQKTQDNSATDETPSHLIESNKEITQKNEENGKEEKETTKGKEMLQRLSAATKSVVLPYFGEEDVIAALEEIHEKNASNENPGYKEILQTLRKRGAATIKELPGWLKL